MIVSVRNIYPRGFAPRTPLHALSLAASPARSDRVARSRRSLAPSLLERHRSRDLQRVTLERRSVEKLFEILQAQAHLALRQGNVRRETQRIDPVTRAALRGGDGRPGLVRRLPLSVADEAELQLRVVVYPD